MTASPPAVRALVFDLGNVLIDIDFMRCAQYWSACANVPPAQIVGRFRVDPHYEAFERGHMPARAYFDNLRRQLDLDLSVSQMTTGWNLIIGPEKPRVRTCIQALKPHFPLYILTNTNAVHTLEWSARHRDLLRHFDHLFVSSTMGCRKPEADAYRKVVATSGVPADGLLFLDDTHENVTGARAAGLTACQVRRDADIPRLTAELLSGRPG